MEIISIAIGVAILYTFEDILRIVDSQLARRANVKHLKARVKELEAKVASLEVDLVVERDARRGTRREVP